LVVIQAAEVIAAVAVTQQEQVDAPPGSHDCSNEQVEAVMLMGDQEIETTMLGATSDFETSDDDGSSSKEKVRFYCPPWLFRSCDLLRVRLYFFV
jgi:hypothetical protein